MCNLVSGSPTTTCTDASKRDVRIKKRAKSHQDFELRESQWKICRKIYLWIVLTQRDGGETLSKRRDIWSREKGIVLWWSSKKCKSCNWKDSRRRLLIDGESPDTALFAILSFSTSFLCIHHDSLSRLWCPVTRQEEKNEWYSNHTQQLLMLVLNYKQDKGFTEGQTETLKVRENGSTFFPLTLM